MTFSPDNIIDTNLLSVDIQKDIFADYFQNIEETFQGSNKWFADGLDWDSNTKSSEGFDINVPYSPDCALNIWNLEESSWDSIKWSWEFITGGCEFIDNTAPNPELNVNVSPQIVKFIDNPSITSIVVNGITSIHPYTLNGVNYWTEDRLKARVANIKKLKLNDGAEFFVPTYGSISDNIMRWNAPLQNQHIAFFLYVLNFELGTNAQISNFDYIRNTKTGATTSGRLGYWVSDPLNPLVTIVMDNTYEIHCNIPLDLRPLGELHYNNDYSDLKANNPLPQSLKWNTNDNLATQTRNNPLAGNMVPSLKEEALWQAL